MANEEAIKWIRSLMSDIGNPHYEGLWPYAQALSEIIAMLEDQEAFINRLYHEIKKHWNMRRQMSDASSIDLAFLVGLLEKMEADEPPMERK